MKLSQIDAVAFLKEFQSVASCAAKRESRPILTCVNVYIDFNKKTLTMTATDSAILAKRIDRIESIEVENPDGWNYVSLNIPAKQFIDIVKNSIPNKAKVCPLAIEHDESDKDNIKVSVGYINVTVPLIKGDYPAISSITNGIDKRFDNANEFSVVSLSTSSLKSMVDYAEKIGQDYVTIAIPGQPGFFMKPVAFRTSQELGNTYGVIAPLRTR